MHLAWEEQRKAKADIVEEGARVLRQMEKKGGSGIVLAGRPYHIDPEINHGIPELIADGRTGWLFPAGDRRALQAAIERIWQSSEPEAFRPACRAVKFDSLEEYAQKLLQLYGQEGCASNV